MGLDKVTRIANRRHCWILSAVFFGIAMLLEAGGKPVRELLAYNRAEIGAGELWRLLSAHFVHLGWTHMLLNIAGLALVTWLVGGAFSWIRWLLVSVITIATIDAGFWLLYTELDWYVGLSGVLHGLLVAGLYSGIREKDRESIVLLGFVLAKLVWEQLSGPLPGSESTSGGAVIVNAHLYGTAGGAMAGALLWRSPKAKASI